MFLAPVLGVGLLMQRHIPLWSFGIAYVAALAGAFAYFAHDWSMVAAVLPEAHKYMQLLVVCVVVLSVGFAAVLAGARKG